MESKQLQVLLHDAQNVISEMTTVVDQYCELEEKIQVLESRIEDKQAVISDLDTDEENRNARLKALADKITEQREQSTEKFTREKEAHKKQLENERWEATRALEADIKKLTTEKQKLQAEYEEIKDKRDEENDKLMEAKNQLADLRKTIGG
jgi:chromosome segregation ATPase